MQVSLIIPTYNEEKTIGKLLSHLETYGDDRLLEIIIVVGGSNDRTV